MRTIPSAINNGFANGDILIWLVKIQASGGNTYYWPTVGKNRTGQALILKETALGAALTYDSSMIHESGIGAVENSADIELGGSVASVSDFNMQIMNHNRFDKNIISAGIDLENRVIELFFGFLPSGSNPTIVIQTDMIRQFTGVIDDVMDFDYRGFALKCIDGTFIRHTNIPTAIVDKISYPNAPSESIGQPLPLVYGDFASATMENDIKTEVHNPCPSVFIDEINRVFAFSNHAMHTFPAGNTFLLQSNKFYVYESTMNIFAVLASTNITVTNSAGISKAQINDLPVKTNIYFQGKGKGSITQTGILNFEYGVDESLTSYVLLDGSDITKKEVAYRPTRAPGAVLDSAFLFAWNVMFGTISGSSGGILIYQKDGGVKTASTAFSDADSGSEVQGTLSLKPSEIVNYQLGVSSPAGTTQIKNVYMQLNDVVIFDFSEPRIIPESGPQFLELTPA